MTQCLRCILASREEKRNECAKNPLHEAHKNNTVIYEEIKLPLCDFEIPFATLCVNAFNSQLCKYDIQLEKVITDEPRGLVIYELIKF